MGTGCSHMNLWALSCIIRAPNGVVLDIMKQFELDNIVLANEEEYSCQESYFSDLLVRMDIHASDRDVFEDFFRLLDKRNRGITNIRHVLICCAALTTKDIYSLFLVCLKIMDRKETKMIDKTDLVIICKLLNDVCFFVSDKALPVEQVYDLVNSVYTNCGKIDGQIYYPDIIEYLSGHPVVILFTSKQFQGSIASKLLSDDQIEAAAKLER